MSEQIEAPEAPEANTDNGQSAPENGKPTYANDGSEGLDAFLGETVGSDYLEKVSEPQAKPEPVKKEEEEVETAPVDKETQEKIDAIITKAETEELSIEEIAFMKDLGYEVNEDDQKEEGAPEKEGEEKKDGEKDKPVDFKLPETFTSELDDFFDDDEGYDPEKITVEDRLKYASKAIKTMRGNQTKLQQVFDSSPEVAGFISDIVRGESPQKAIKNNMPELLEADSAPDPSKDKEAYDQWVIDQHEQKQERERQRMLRDDHQKNRVKSVQEAEEFVYDKQLADKKKQKSFFNELDRHFQDIGRGYVSKEFMGLVFDGMYSKENIAAAERAGEVKGMNKKITFKKRNGDGLARMKSANKKEPKRGAGYKDEGTKQFAEFIGD